MRVSHVRLNALEDRVAQLRVQFSQNSSSDLLKKIIKTELDITQELTNIRFEIGAR